MSLEKIIWQLEAQEDLIQIYNYISKDSIYYADITIKNIAYSVNDLLIFPYMGRKLPQANNSIVRETPYKSYRIIYEVSKSCIYILRVVHKSRILYPNFI